MPPLLLLIHARPHCTRQVVERLKALGIRDAYLAADGPKDSRQARLCEETREICLSSGIFSHTLLSDRYLGCRRAVLRGIGWFLDVEQEGIILEDDCLPNGSFLSHCERMLGAYREAKNVYMVSGSNPLGSWHSGHGHHFARIGHIWGWATWRDRWQDFHPDLPSFGQFIAEDGPVRLFGNTGIGEAFAKNVRMALSGELDTWDFLWTAHHAIRGRLATIPTHNLVENIGFGADATHTPLRPRWLVTEAADGEEVIPGSAPFPDMEYEMALHLSRASDSPSLPSSSAMAQKASASGKKLRVVQVATTDTGGGAESAVLRHHRWLRKQGHGAILLVATCKNDEEGVLEMTSSINGQVLALQPDIVHAHNIHGTPYGLGDMAALSHRVPVLWTLHDCWAVSGSTRHPFTPHADGLSYLDLLEWEKEFLRRKETLRSSRIRISCPSHWLRWQVWRAHGILAHFVPNGVSTEHASPIKPPSERYILFVANRPERNPYKDYPTLERAWRMAIQHGFPYDLVIVGGQVGEQRCGSQRLIGQGKLPNNAVLTLMGKAAFAVQASVLDNAPTTLLEAHSCGTPVLASLSGGIPELLTGAEARLAYRAGDAGGLCRALLQFQESLGELCGSLGVAQQGADPSLAFLGHYHELLRDEKA